MSGPDKTGAVRTGTAHVNGVQVQASLAEVTQRITVPAHAPGTGAVSAEAFDVLDANGKATAVPVIPSTATVAS